MTIEKLRTENWIIYEIHAGSRLYNIADKNSDIDIRGIFNVPLYQYLCNRHPTKITVDDGDADIVFMEVVTYLNLACAGNPNIIDWLYVENAEEACKSLEMCELIDIKEKFITKTFLRKSLSMGLSMIERCKRKKEKQWKMLAHAQRILFTVYTKVDDTSQIYSPKMMDLDREIVMDLKHAKKDYWSEVSRLELGLQSLFARIDIVDNISEKFDPNLKDELILNFKTKYHGIETSE